MKVLDDTDKTFIPETLDDCAKIAALEGENQSYDIGKHRDLATAKQNRIDGKLTECRIVKHLNDVGFGFVHGVRAGKKYADCGADAELDEKHGSIKLQIKFTRSKHMMLSFCDGVYSSAEDRLNKLCNFDGAIIVVHEDADKKRTAYVGSGKTVAENYESSKHSGYVFRFSKHFKQLHDFSYGSLMEEFRKAADGRS